MVGRLTAGDDPGQSGVAALGGPGYQGGHIARARFGGPPEEINTVPMTQELNQGVDGTYESSFRKFEDSVATSPDEYNRIVIEIEYDGPGSVASGTSLHSLPAEERIPVRLTSKWVGLDGLGREWKFSNESWQIGVGSQ